MDDETATMSSVLTLVPRLSYDPTSSVILLKLSSEQQILLKTLREKYDLRQFWEQSSPPTLTFHISERFGNGTQKKNAS